MSVGEKVPRPSVTQISVSPEIRAAIQTLANAPDMVYDPDVITDDLQYLIEYARSVERELKLRDDKK